MVSCWDWSTTAQDLNLTDCFPLQGALCHLALCFIIPALDSYFVLILMCSWSSLLFIPLYLSNYCVLFDYGQSDSDYAFSSASAKPSCTYTPYLLLPQLFQLFLCCLPMPLCCHLSRQVFLMFLQTSPEMYCS